MWVRRLHSCHPIPVLLWGPQVNFCAQPSWGGGGGGGGGGAWMAGHETTGLVLRLASYSPGVKSIFREGPEQD